jgi:hypothetical protein
LLELVIKSFPAFIEVLPVILVLLYRKDLLLDWVHSQGFFEGEGVDFLEDSFQSNQTLL